jgi:hypothetical protein
MKKKNTEIFILEAKSVHGDRYDYSLVEYVNNSTKVKIVCPIHGVFEQTPVKHFLQKQGCPKCGQISTHDKQRKTLDDFISEARLVHGDKYDYSLAEYKRNRKNIKIICPIHGVFEQTPSNHLKGKGCKYCGGTAKMDRNDFILKAKLVHGEKYDYSLVEYENGRIPVKIICPIHGVFEQYTSNHLSKKQGCYDCLGKVHDIETFIEKSKQIHSDFYDYSLVNYTNNHKSVEIICPIHGKFEQAPSAHTIGQKCPKCANNSKSKYEEEIDNFIKSLGFETTRNNKKILNGLEIDIFIPSKNIAIEFNGLYWHSEIYLENNYHLKKTELCENNNIRLLHIFEDEWVEKSDIVKSRIKNILGISDKKIHARKCAIKIIDNKLAKDFSIKNHIQGHVNAKINIGLFYNDELVSIMTFGSLRKLTGNKNIDNKYELLRFCNKLDTIVIGGANKLLSYFVKNYSPIEIISYADRRWSQGNLYEKLGFTKTHTSKPNYFYVIKKNRFNRFNYRKDVLVSQGFDKNKSEHQIMLERGIHRIYDCGNICFKLNLNR